MSGEVSNRATATRDYAVRQFKDLVCSFVSFAKSKATLNLLRCFNSPHLVILQSEVANY